LHRSRPGENRPWPRLRAGRSAGEGAAIDPIELIIDGLATYRLTRLATADVISERWRRSLVDRLSEPGDGVEAAAEAATAQAAVDSLEEPPKLAQLITCRWCAGMWIAGGVVVARALAPKAWSPVARGLALSAGATLMARVETD